MQKLIEWWWQGVNVSLPDLQNAYLQIHIDKALWPFQTVIFRGQRFSLTQLGFGLNVAPLIMKSVIDAIVSQDHMIKSATSAYVDDILINESLVPASRMQQHFLDNGLVSKDPVQLRDGARVLGLQVWKKDGTLRWKRGSQIPEIPDGLTHRHVFSLCRKLVDHFPVCGWLRVAVAFIKHLATAVTKGRDDRIKNVSLCHILAETLTRVWEADPIGGNWCMDSKEITVWVDESCIATGVVLETNGTVIEDACWLRQSSWTQRGPHRSQFSPSMGGNSVTLGHRFSMGAPVDFRDFNWKSTCEHESSWQDTNQAMVRNLAITDERIWTGHRRETHEVLSEPRR